MATLTAKQALFVREYLVDLNATQAAIRAGYPLRPCSRSEVGAYVYLLADAVSGEVFYVGKGTGRRFLVHFQEARSGGGGGNPIKCRRIAEALAAGGVVAWCFDSELSDGDALRLERALIQVIGIERLTNVGSGQITDAERAECMLSRVKPFDVWLSECPRPELHVEMYHKLVASLTEMAAR